MAILGVMFLPYICWAAGPQSEYIMEGIQKSPWGFEVTLPEGMKGHHNGATGMQGHGMIIPIEFKKDICIGWIEIFAGYNAGMDPNPGCAAWSLHKNSDENGKILESTPIPFCGFDGWRVVTLRNTKLGLVKREEITLLRGKDVARKVTESHFSKELLRKSFDVGCTATDKEVPYLEYNLYVEAPLKSFQKRRAEFWKILKTWKFILAEN